MKKRMFQGEIKNASGETTDDAGQFLAILIIIAIMAAALLAMIVRSKSGATTFERAYYQALVKKRGDPRLLETPVAPAHEAVQTLTFPVKVVRGQPRR